jgi:ribose-phosphate pyrophosphokinase
MSSDQSHDRDRVMQVILPLPGNDAFARSLADVGRHELGELQTRRFPDGETYVRIVSDVKDKAVHLVCTLARPDDGFLRLIFVADAARALGAREVTLIAPYLAYMRQDDRFQSGEAITSRTFARLVSSTFDRLLTVDPHLHRYPALSALYTIPAQTLHAAPLLADWIRAQVDQPLIIGPDEESQQWVSDIARRIDAPYAVLRKIRHGDRKIDVELPDLSRWKSRNPVLVDDIASSGHTLIEAAHKLPRQGFPRPVCAVIHGVFAEDSYQRLKAVADRVVSSDSIPHQSNAIPLLPLVASTFASAESPQQNFIRHRHAPDFGDGAEETDTVFSTANTDLPRMDRR